MSRINPKQLAIPLLALFIALGGTGYAAAKLNGKSVKNRTIAGAKFKSNTLIGKQIRESKLGAVPAAKVADSATSANGLTAAGSSGLMPAGRAVDTGLIKLDKAANIAGAPLRIVFQSGPFKIEASCYGAGTEAGYRLRVTSTEPGSMIGDEPLPFDGEAQAPTNDAGTEDSMVGLIAPSGKTLVLDFLSGVNTLGAECVFLADGLTSY